MRVFAWLCVVVGILIAVAAVAYPTLHQAWVWRSGVNAAASRAMSDWSALRPPELSWSAVAAGAGVTAFGILLLAIRRPAHG
jgi:hypothetical protein